MCIKLVELFANRVVERRNMINDYLSGRDCIESVRGSVDAFALVRAFLAFLCHFAWLYLFLCRLLAFAVFILLDDILDIFLAFCIF
jgi:hypothetical protein